jgi:hypothetical protein
MIAIALMGVFILAFGIFGMLWPRALIWRIERWWRSPVALQIAIGFRMGLGLLLITLAADTHYPRTIGVIGAISLAAAIGLGFIGYSRLRRVIEWWIDRPDAWIRAACLPACLFGALLIHATPLAYSLPP